MIGVFDSGLGGLTILKALTQQLPQYDYIYLGDTARVPYGNRSPECVYEFTRQGVDALFAEGCELIIIGCNTSTALALRRLQQTYLPDKAPRKRILGVIRPIVEEITKIGDVKKVGVIATRATARSHVYQKEIHHICPSVRVIEKATPLLVPLIEEGWAANPITKKILRGYLADLKRKQVDYLIPGCTHYALVVNLLRQIMGRRSKVLDIGKIVALSLDDYLKRHRDLENKISRRGSIQFLTTDSVDRFNDSARFFWGRSVKSRKINLV